MLTLFATGLKYRAIQLQIKSGLDQLHTVELPLDDRKAGELRIRGASGPIDSVERRDLGPSSPVIRALAPGR